MIIHINDSCFGYTYDTGPGFCKANFVGRYNDSTGRLRGVNTDFIERTFAHGLSSYQLKYYRKNGSEYLDGKASPKQAVVRLLSLGLGIPITYKKVSAGYDTTTLIAAKLIPRPVNAELQISPRSAPATGLDSLHPAERKLAMLDELRRSRSSQIINTIVTSADTLRLFLHDNGEIDQDTVTVFHNGRIIINQLGLALKPFEMILPIYTPNSIHSIELMANNLGTIPPNTAYLTIRAGRDKYELRLSSDYSINARIDILHWKSE